MSQSNTKNSEVIANADAIIERFGGIRPMANKMGVAATTVQGWKKRDVIPMRRKEAILKAAQDHDIDLSDLISNGNASAPSEPPAKNDNFEAALDDADARPPVPPEEEEEEEEGAQTVKAFVLPPKTTTTTKIPTENSAIEYALAAEKKAVTKSIWVSTVLVLIGFTAAFAILWPKTEQNNTRLQDVETTVANVQSDIDKMPKKSLFGSFVPEDLQNQISSLQRQAQETQAQVNAAITKVQEISNDITAQDAGTLTERLARLEGHTTESLGQGNSISSMLVRLNALQHSVNGEGQVEQALGDLNAVLSSSATNTESGLQNALEVARAQSSSLSNTMQDVPAQDLKAAAMLMGLSQFRSALNRDNKSFTNDLDVLNSLVGEDNTELREAITRLAPHAESGVLTTGGLSNELKSIAGDAVIASLQGEEVSIQERAQARFNELLSVEQNGALVTGTPTQQTISQAQNQIQQGNIDQALTLIEQIDGPAADVLAPWVGRAEATRLARDLENLIKDAIRTNSIAGIDLNTLLSGGGLAGGFGGGAGGLGTGGLSDLGALIPNGTIPGLDLGSLNLDGLGLEQFGLQGLGDLQGLNLQSLGGAVAIPQQQQQSAPQKTPEELQADIDAFDLKNIGLDNFGQ